MDINMDSIGKRIRDRRKELGLTQTDIYEQCEITSGALSKIENGTRVPSVLSFYSLSQVLKCSVDWLITGDSSFEKNVQICSKEEEVLSAFRELDVDDQDEIIGIMNMKLNRAKRKKDQSARSSSSEGSENDILVG